MKKRVSKEDNLHPGDEQNLCIWMTAGVISFKLCPFNYGCERCDFDKAMRSQVKSEKVSTKVKKGITETLGQRKTLPKFGDDSKKPFLFFTFSVDKLNEGLYLHPGHLWARRIDDKKWRVGVDQLLAYILPPPAKLEWFDLKKDFLQDQVIGKILTQAGPVFLTLPFSGRVIQTNSRLDQCPDLLQQDPYGEGWLVMIDQFQDHSELEKLHTGLAGRRFLEEEAHHLKFLLKHRGIEVDQIGETLRDGGVNIKYLHQVLPAEVCLRLAVELIMTGKQAW
jgi:glycine cleavage system H protein